MGPNTINLMLMLFGMALGSDKGRSLALHQEMTTEKYAHEATAEFFSMVQALVKTDQEIASTDEACSKADVADKLQFNYMLYRNELV